MDQRGQVAAFQMSETEVIEALQNSVYPGASVNSIRLVINVCRASGKDPFQKPYHIVPMWDNNDRKYYDVIMPGINDYRITASRTGEHTGTDEPEFGPDVTEKVGDLEITYPQWCRVRVHRIVDGKAATFTAVERWKENYASKKKTDETPNAMWSKRPYAQLAKCAEAQALRKGFPEVGAAPTMEEMSGSDFFDTDVMPDQRSGSRGENAGPSMPRSAGRDRSAEADQRQIEHQPNQDQRLPDDMGRQQERDHAHRGDDRQQDQRSTGAPQDDRREHGGGQRQQEQRRDDRRDDRQTGGDQGGGGMSGRASDGMLTYIRNKLREKNIGEDVACNENEVAALDQATDAEAQRIIAWIKGQ